MKGPVPFKTLLFLCLFLLAVMTVSAGPLHAASGEITSITASGDLTVRAGGPLELKTGHAVEISYMAGVMEMLIGLYRVTGVNDKNEVTLKPVSVNMPPSKGMRVIINMTSPSNILPVQK